MCADESVHDRASLSSLVGKYDAVPRYYATIRALMSEYQVLNERFIFTGPVPEAELVDLLQRASVVAIPSLYEGFSLPAIEAMACATPLVTTDAGALPEVVGTEAGLRVKAGDVGELATALGALTYHPTPWPARAFSR